MEGNGRTELERGQRQTQEAIYVPNDSNGSGSCGYAGLLLWKGRDENFLSDLNGTLVNFKIDCHLKLESNVVAALQQKTMNL